MKGNVTLNGKKIHGITALAFAGNQKIKKVKLKDIEAIGEKAFVRSSVTEVSLIGGEILGHNLFNNCRRLRKIYVSGIKTIPENTFVSIPALKKLILGRLKAMQLQIVRSYTLFALRQEKQWTGIHMNMAIKMYSKDALKSNMSI